MEHYIYNGVEVSEQAYYLLLDIGSQRDTLRAQLATQQGEGVRLREALIDAKRFVSAECTAFEEEKGEEYTNGEAQVHRCLNALAASPRTALLAAVIEAAEAWRGGYGAIDHHIKVLELRDAIDALRAFDAGQEG